MTFKYGSSFAGAENLAMCFDAANPDCYPGSGTTATNLGTRLAYNDNDTIVGIIGSSMTIPTSPTRFKTNATSGTDDIDYNIILQDGSGNWRSILFADESAWTQEAVVKSVTGTSWQGISGRGATSPWWTLYISSSTNWHQRWRDAGGHYRTGATQTTNINEWHHLVVTADTSRNIRLYTNGVLTNTIASTNTQCQIQRICAGYSSGGNKYPLRGELLYYRAYDKTLSDNEVMRNYGAMLGRTL
tara:strand:- start:14 stop:745 length:732 start_codon:yes stop_codon:yes gene_type:complete